MAPVAASRSDHVDFVVNVSGAAVGFAEQSFHEMRNIARGFPADRNAPIWTFIRGGADFDPMPHWLSVDQPVLVLYGARDEADNVPVTESIRRLRFAFDLIGKANRRIRTIPGGGHGFMTNDGQLMPEFVEELMSWIEVQTRGGG